MLQAGENTAEVARGVGLPRSGGESMMFMCEGLSPISLAGVQRPEPAPAAAARSRSGCAALTGATGGRTLASTRESRAASLPHSRRQLTPSRAAVRSLAPGPGRASGEPSKLLGCRFDELERLAVRPGVEFGMWRRRGALMHDVHEATRGTAVLGGEGGWNVDGVHGIHL